MTHVIGIDPGLVHTGCVSMLFDRQLHTISVTYALVDGLDEQTTATWVQSFGDDPHVFVEAYRPRTRLDSDQRMVEGQARFRGALPNPVFLPNMGIKRIIPQQVMEVCGVWSFATPTHHQDLRSAARIALFGMVKNTSLNRVLSDAVKAHLSGTPWTVKHV
jgi:hypothetical protein